MTDQQRAFVDAYFTYNFNASRAAEEVGYAFPRQQGWEVKNLPDVKAEIERRFAERAASADEVLGTVAGIMRASIRDCYSVQDFSRFPMYDPKKAFETGAIDFVKSVTTEKDGSLKVEMHDKLAAAVQLGKHLKLWTDKTELSGSVDLSAAAADADNRFFARVGAAEGERVLGEPNDGSAGGT